MSLWHQDKKDGQVVSSMSPFSIIAALVLIVVAGIAYLMRK